MVKSKEGALRKRRKKQQQWKQEANDSEEDSEILSSDEELEEANKHKLKESTAVQEGALEKRNRLAQDLLSKIETARKANTDQDDTLDEFEQTDQVLRKEVLRSEGRLIRSFADVMQVKCKTHPVVHFSYRSSHSMSVTSVCVSSDERTCFSGSKDGSIVGWDIETESLAWKPAKPQDSRVLGLACSSDGTYVASCGDKKGSTIRIWDVRDPSPKGPIRELTGHRDVVTQVVFRHNSTTLLSASDDRSVRIYNAAEGSFIEHLFGHQARITALDCLSRERCVTSAEDMTVRLWKIPEETHLLLSGKHHGSIDCVKMLNEATFVSGSQDGNLALWNVSKRRPVSFVPNAHGVNKWIESLAAVPNSDIIASGSDEGIIRVWRVDLNRLKIDPDPIAALPCEGHINSLAFAPTSASFVVAGVGQEPRLGRWRVASEAKNRVHVFRLPRVAAAEDTVI